MLTEHPSIAARRLFFYRPYGHPDSLCPDGKLWKKMHERGLWQEWSNKPWQLEFHNLGATKIERAQFTGNGVGKTEDASMETAYHATGLYPAWWQGKRIERSSFTIWVGSKTNDNQREYTQPALFGSNLESGLGTGSIPRNCLTQKPRTRQAGVPDVIDTAYVQHHDKNGKKDGIVTIRMKTFEQGWKAFTGGRDVLVIWFDEFDDEPFKVYTEALTRILRNDGIIYVTVTLLTGHNELTLHYLDKKASTRAVVVASWDDAPHLTPDKKEHMRLSYPDHEMQAREFGAIMMGMGRIFTVQEQDLLVDLGEIPRYWPRLKGIDWGQNHPAGMAEIAWDRENDIIYALMARRDRIDDVYEHAEIILSQNAWVPVSWPHDVARKVPSREKPAGNKEVSGQRLKDHYVHFGVPMLGRQACYRNDKLGPQPQEPIIEEMKEREVTGRFKLVRGKCDDYRKERLNYHRNDKGDPVSISEDTLKALFYAVMMKRYAATPSSLRKVTNVQSRMPLSMR